MFTIPDNIHSAITKHADLRLAQRNIPPEAVEYTIKYGKKVGNRKT